VMDAPIRNESSSAEVAVLGLEVTSEPIAA
jgi:hypothetical protein